MILTRTTLTVTIILILRITTTLRLILTIMIIRNTHSTILHYTIEHITIECSVRAFSTGMPAMALLGSSSASLFTCSVGGGKDSEGGNRNRKKDRVKE
jgi:hypothetical protein